MKWISTILISSSLLTSLLASPGTSTPIPADSKSPYEFRGKPTADYPPYAAVFQAKTYGELKERLENFFTQWEKDKKPLDDLPAINMYFHCQEALIRTCYLLGETEAGDEHLMRSDGARNLWSRINDRGMEQGKITRIAKEIQTIHQHLGLKDPFAKGMPKDMTELYLPLVHISQATQASREKEPEEELEDE